MTEYTKLTPDQKKAWTNALRSGEYTQFQHGLYKKPKCMCCIGVGATVLAPGFDPRRNITGDATEAIGLNTHTALKLVAMNDTHGKTFPEIADWIDANL